MKKLFIALAMMTLSLAANAQFEKGKMYVGASLSGLDMNYNGSDKFKMNLDLKAGSFVTDNWLAYGVLGYNRKSAEGVTAFGIGVGCRYYILQNGLILGLQGKYEHANPNYNDFKPACELGYCFFVGKEMTIEPSLYYEHSFKNHSQYSTIGLKVGIGLYLGKNKIKSSVKEAFFEKEKK